MADSAIDTGTPAIQTEQPNLDTSASLGPTPARPPAPTEQPTIATPSAGELPKQTQPAYEPPVVLTPHQNPLMKVINSALDALTGGTQPEMATGSDGQKYVKQVVPGRGAQWLKLGAEAIQGAAAGLAHGKGAGNIGKGAEAGVNAGIEDSQRQQQQEQNMNDEARKENLENANHQMLVMNMAEQAWRQTRLKVEATQKDVEFAQGQEDRLTKEGGQVLGVAAHPWDIGGILKVNPDVMKDMVQKQLIKTVPHYDSDGKPDGVSVIQMPNDYAQQELPAGTVFHTWDPIKNEYIEHHSSDPITAQQRDAYDTAAGVQAAKFKSDKTEADLKQAQIDEAKFKSKPDPSEQARNYAEARKANAEADKVKSGAVNPDGTPNPRFEALAQALYDGDILPADLKREAKGANLDPNEVMGRAVEIGKAQGKPFSESIIEQEHKFASNVKTQAAMDGIDRILGKPGAAPGTPEAGYMNQMLKYAQDANLTTHGLFNSAALAVARGLGDTQAKNFNTAVSETRRSIAGLIGNPVLGGSDSDKKLEQADDLLGKSPTLENLQGAADVLRTALETQRTSMTQSNRFLAKRYGSGAQQQAHPVQVQPGEQIYTNPQTQQQVVLRNGKYVDIKTGQAVQ